MGSVRQLVVQQRPTVPPQLTYLNEAFAQRLQRFNAMTRALRGAGIEITHLVQLDNRIFINADDSDLLKSNFFSELRGLRFSTKGKWTHNVVTIRGVDVAWLSPVKEQDR